MHIALLSLLIFNFLFLQFGDCAETTCEDSQKHFANLCFSPKPFTDIDYGWMQIDHLSSGWYWLIGNDIARLHFSSVLKGEQLSYTDNFDDLCFRTKVLNSNEEKKTVDGLYLGFNNLSSNWTCKQSADTPGLFLCDDFNPQTKYHENYNSYVAYSDNKSFLLGIVCFPNGQVGWNILSVNATLTETEKKIVDDKITSLGFSSDNTVVFHDKENKCLE